MLGRESPGVDGGPMHEQRANCAARYSLDCAREAEGLGCRCGDRPCGDRPFALPQHCAKIYILNQNCRTHVNTEHKAAASPRVRTLNVAR
jgi:hypothetical protein